MKSINIARLLLVLIAIAAPVTFILAIIFQWDTPTLLPVAQLLVSASWFSPRFRSIYRRGIIFATKGGIVLSNETRMVGNSFLALSDDVYKVSTRVRRFMERLEREHATEEEYELA